MRIETVLRLLAPAAATAATALVAACATAPAQAPTLPADAAPAPAAFREGGAWILIDGSTTPLPAAWWQAFRDPGLDALEQAAEAGNPAIDAARAAHRSALAALAQGEAALLPTASVGAAATRQRDGSYSPRVHGFAGTTWNDTEAGLQAAWSPDLWGTAHDDVRADRSLAAAAQASEAGVRLSTQTLVAATYFDIRQLDADLALRRRLRALDLRQADIARAAADHGTGSRDDVLRAQSGVDAQDARLAQLARGREAADHALAALVGKPPAEQTLAAAATPIGAELPIAPVLPSELLRARPDIVEALRRVDAAGASLQASRGAYFPSLTLDGSAGLQGAGLAQLLRLPTAVWSIGPALAAPLFDGGLRAARIDAASAARDAAVADYRATVLGAFQEVEDLLSTCRRLSERDAAAQAVADKAETLWAHERRQRQRGLASLNDELTARRSALEARLAWQDGVHQRRDAELLLAKAVGGGAFAQAPS